MMAEEFWRRGEGALCRGLVLPQLLGGGEELKPPAAEGREVGLGKGGQIPSQKGSSFFVTSMCYTHQTSFARPGADGTHLHGGGRGWMAASGRAATATAVAPDNENDRAPPTKPHQALAT
jgi:hypothetical protein